MAYKGSNKNWTVYAKRADFSAISKKYGIDPVVARILVNRDVSEEQMSSFLRPGKKDFNNPHLMKDMDKACALIVDAIESGKNFRIIGDYDIDGICATYILKKTMESLGARVDYYLPKRIEDGYGIKKTMVDRAIADGVDFIITCDNGIAAEEVIKYARDKGLVVVVTDHHEIPRDANGREVILESDAVIDPKRSDCQYPFKEICGAVVSWKLSICLLEAMGRNPEDAMEFIEFAAFATIGDIMLLKDENRAIVFLGMKKMSHSRNTGLRMLIECCGLNGKQLNAYHIGFVLGPCLNAGGRLSDARLGLELFEAADQKTARELAQRLLALNEERKQMTSDGTDEAVRTIEENGYEKDRVIVTYVPGVHESLCGIIAGRLKEKYQRPCFMLTDGENHVKGSGRSISLYSMYERLCECQDLFLMFGGHPMAAGLSIEKEKVGLLRTYLNENSGLCMEDLVEKTMIDVPMPIGYITKELIRQIEGLEPFGNGNEKPVFAQKDVCVWKSQRIGRNGEFLKLVLKSDEHFMEALYFGDVEKFLEMVSEGDAIDIIYYPQINEFRGCQTLQVVIKDYRKKEEESL